MKTNVNINETFENLLNESNYRNIFENTIADIKSRKVDPDDAFEQIEDFAAFVFQKKEKYENFIKGVVEIINSVVDDEDKLIFIEDELKKEIMMSKCTVIFKHRDDEGCRLIRSCMEFKGKDLRVKRISELDMIEISHEDGYYYCNLGDIKCIDIRRDVNSKEDKIRMKI